MDEWTDERIAECERIVARYKASVNDPSSTGFFEALRDYQLHCGDNCPSAIAEIRRLQGENKRLQQRLTMLSAPLNEMGIIT